MIVILAVLYLPVFVWLGENWLGNPYYGHGFIVPLISGVAFWLRREELKTGKPGTASIVIIASGLLIYFVSYSLWGYFFIAALTFPVVLFGTISYLCGMERARRFLFPVLFLFFMIPLPFTDRMAIFLQNLTVHASSDVAGWFGITVQTSGNQISIPGAQFVVGPQCSGMNSLIALFTLSAFMAFMVLDCARKWRRTLLFLSAVPFALVGNIIRTALILVIAEAWGTEAALDYFHTWSSPLLFILALGLLVIISKLLGCRIKSVAALSGRA